MRSWLTLLFPRKCANQSFFIIFLRERKICLEACLPHEFSQRGDTNTQEHNHSGKFLTTSPSWHHFLQLRGQTKSFGYLRKLFSVRFVTATFARVTVGLPL